ncbi:MAG: XRE family transcriptional regulator, partial [Myxococcaceae bacterium]
MTNFLRDRRMRGRISQAELAKELGVSQQTIARWEITGQIPAKHLKDLAVTLG